MTLSSALNIAASGMRATQTAISTTSNNIANADVDGYTRKTVSPQTVVVSGVGAGVSLSEIQRQVDAGLERRTNAARSESSLVAIVSDYLSQLTSAIGSTTGDDTIASAIGNLTSSLQSLSVSPNSASEAQSVVSNLTDLATSANSLTDSIQDLRADADRAIADSVDTVNASLARLDELNDQVLRAAAAGASTADLVDAQMQEIAILSEQLNISYYTDSNGAISVYGPGGTVLLNDDVHELDYSTTASIDSNDTLANGSLSGISVGGKDITSFISGGTIGGLLEVRDEILPAQQESVDLLVDQLVAAANDAQNAGTSVPAPNALTSSAAVEGTAALNGSGTLRIAVLGDDGSVQSYTDLDLSSYTTVDDLVAAMDAIGGVSATIGSDGKLTVSADDSAMGIGLAQVSGGIGSDNVSVSSAFGLNDLLIKDSSGHLSLREDISSDPSLLARSSLSTDAALAVGDAGIVTGDNSAVAAMLSAFTTDRNFAATGDLGAVSGSLSDYASEIISHIAVLSENAEASAEIKANALSNLSGSLANASGVNLDEEAAELEILQTNYQAAANVISVIQEMYDTLLNMV
ncbi:flagellar hook-associated protein FlgK [Dongia sp.]|uniref:flagellar hook-associated protein FlgK n=1 Tax=Dongia sp. TaxID=1977262 RepID=UPI0035B1DF2C